jgi:hypothetical protein
MPRSKSLSTERPFGRVLCATDVRSGGQDEREERETLVEVRLDPLALEAMVLSVLEGYLSPRKDRRKGYEVYGINFGAARQYRRHTPREGLRTTRSINVMRAQPQLSADGSYGFVEPNTVSLRAMLPAARTIYPRYQVIGDFHSHPYDSLGALEFHRGWRYTRTDERSNIDVARTLVDLHQRSLVTFVLAIARCSQRPHRRLFRRLPNTRQLSVGGCRIILAAYRCLASGRLSAQNVHLHLSERST